MSTSPSPTPSRSGILYSSPSHDLFLLDVPTSIRAAQGPLWHKALLSRPALTEPLRSTEPKTTKARQVLADRGQGVVDGDEGERVRVISEALEVLQREYTGAYIIPRRVRAQASAIDGQRDELTEVLKAMLHSSTHFITSSQCEYALDDSANWQAWPPSGAPMLTNSSSSTISLNVRVRSIARPVTFYIPPHSSFLMSTLPPPTPAHTSTPASGFDLILLDPPWPNRSVKRSNQYTGPRSFSATAELLDELSISAHFSTSGETVVAIWITNSASVFEIALNWLDGLGYQVVEEWIWVKTTEKGETIHELDGVWRKTYEVLLVARPMLHDDLSRQKEVERRVIVAVPDLHSRKPNLKKVFETVLGLETGQYEALEVFARGLTVGWHSWGNEALLFNWNCNWVDDVQPENG